MPDVHDVPNEPPQDNATAQTPAVDPNLAQRVMNLYGRIDEVLNELRVPDGERRKVEQNLMEAIGADLMVRLGAKMSEENRDKLMDLAGDGRTQPNLAEVAGFFRDSFSQEDLLTDLGDATESVLTDFVKEMSKGS